LVAAVIAWLIATTAAQAQYVVDNKGRPFPCLPFDTGCTVLPPLGAPLSRRRINGGGRAAALRALRVAL
jgi:hypothetical protein